MTKECFAKGITTFLTMFDNVKMSKEKQTICYDLLKDISDEQFEYAILKICEDVKEFYPNTNFVALVKDQLKTSDKDRATLAWSTVVSAMGKYGAYSSVKFDDAVIHSTINAIGGWIEVCQIQLDQWLQKRFVEIYNSMTEKRNHPEYLRGIWESETGRKPEPKQIKTESGTLVLTQQRRINAPVIIIDSDIII